MIHAAVMQLASQLNQYLQRNLDLKEEMVVVSNISDQDGSLSPHIHDRLLMFLINIEKDPTAQQRPSTRSRQSLNTPYPPLFINLYLMVAANFAGSNYPEALKFISYSISFFQRQPVFDHHNTPELDTRIQQLSVEIANLDFLALSNIWGILSGKYLPSVLYKVRMMAYDADDIHQQLGGITAPVTQVDKKE